MTFLNIGALFGLAAVGIPILIHLLNKMRVRETPWAAMRFLRESLERNQKRLRLEDLLLLLVRCLLVTLLILALSRPTWQSGGMSTGSRQVAAVIILDDSYSMGLTNGIQTRLQEAQAAAGQIVQALPARSSSALFFAADNVEPVIAQPTYDFNLLREKIGEAKLTGRATDLSTALQLAISTLQKHPGGEAKEIYLITDGQANGWPSLDALQKQVATVRKQMSVHLVLVGDAAESNLAVTGLRLDGGLTPVDQQLRCDVEVRNGGEAEARDVRVRLQVDDEPAMEEQVLAGIPAGATRNLTLFAKLRTEGYHTITARIPADRLAADDQRTVAVRSVRQVKVLLVDGTDSATPSRADDFFVRNALIPVASSEVDSYYIKTTSIPAAQFSSASLDDDDGVFLLHVNALDSSQLDALVHYVHQGGGLAVWPGPEADLSFYNQQLGHDDFLPARLAPAKGRPNQQADFFTLQTQDYDHPIVTLWNDPSAGTLGSAHFYAYYPLTLAPWKAVGDGKSSEGGEPRVVLHFAQNNDPFAVEHTWGAGRVILFSSTATTAWNDLPVHPAFVPLMNRVLGSLVARADEGLNIRVGQKFSYVVSADLLNKDFTVSVPGQHGSPRVVGQVTLVDGAPRVEFGDTDQAGAYRVSIGSAPATALAFAAQSDPAESDLTPLSDRQLQALGQVAEVIKWTPDVSLVPKLKSARVGMELWFPLLVAALVIATLETFLAQWFSRAK